MPKRLSPAAVVALKEALGVLYWYKDDLRSFLHQCLNDVGTLSLVDWNNRKRQVASDLVDRLVSEGSRSVGDLTRLCHEVCSVKSFRHLEQLEDGEEKAARAKAAIAHLNSLVNTNVQVEDEDRQREERRKRAAEKLKTNSVVRQKLTELRERYMALVVSIDMQKRGFVLEKVMYDLFELFDLDPKASFRNTGEQIDGAFSLDGTEYLFEARWRQLPSDAGHLDGFAAKVRRKLENTLGVFLSINGFSVDGIKAHSAGGAVIILMDGADLMSVLEERIDFVSLLQRKKRHAAQTGNIFLPIHEILVTT